MYKIIKNLFIYLQKLKWYKRLILKKYDHVGFTFGLLMNCEFLQGVETNEFDALIWTGW